MRKRRREIIRCLEAERSEARAGVNQGDPSRGMVLGGGSQSLHSSWEAPNKRGAKGGRKVDAREMLRGTNHHRECPCG